MSGPPLPPGKLGLSKRLLQSLKPRSRRSSPSPVSLSTTVVTSSTAQSSDSQSTQILVSSSPPSARRVAADSPNASVAASSPQQAASNSSMSHNLLDNALNLLSGPDRMILQKCLLPTSNDITLAVEQALAAAKERQRYCLEKRWRFTFAGREFILKE